MLNGSADLKQMIKDYSIITLGLFVVAFGVYFFKLPNNFSTGGVSGISIIVSGLTNIPKPTLMIAINMLMLLLGFVFLGISFGVRTLYGSLTFSAFIKLFTIIYPMDKPFTSEPLLEMMFAVLLPALGSAILFNYSASSGGTDILALIIKKYTPLDVGKALFAADGLIALSSLFIFGVETGLFSIFGLFAKAVFVDNITESLNTKKCFTIITENPDEISSYIHEIIDRGVTRYECVGTYDLKPRSVLISVVNRYQAKQLQQFIRKVDKRAFVIITNSSNIIGKGFRTPAV
ncbi:MAG: YitT family protein [Eubacteriales bacterium]